MDKGHTARTKKGHALISLVDRLRVEKKIETDSVTAKMPVRLLSTIDAIAKHTKTNRTRVIVTLLDAALGEALAEMDEDLRTALTSKSKRSPTC